MIEIPTWLFLLMAINAVITLSVVLSWLTSDPIVKFFLRRNQRKFMREWRAQHGNFTPEERRLIHKMGTLMDDPKTYDQIQDQTIEALKKPE